MAVKVDILLAKIREFGIEMEDVRFVATEIEGNF